MSLEKEPNVLNPVDTALAVLLTLTAWYVDAVGSSDSTGSTWRT
jgi:hypothetical protein